MNITVIRKIIESFFVSDLGHERDAVQVIGICKAGEGWEAKVISTETNRYLKKLGYPPVYDKKMYMVKLDDNLEVISYWDTDCCEREDEVGTDQKYR
ncbi:MAG: hypothetical protein ACOY30_07105 [Bacillota bacterium]